MYGYIYLILNKVNGKTYVGKHRLYKKTWNEDGYMGSGKLLKPAKKKYGIENFEKFLIEYTFSEEDAGKKEKFWIAEYRNRGKAEYNIEAGGQGGSKPCSEETKKKISEANTGYKQSKERAQKHSESMKGRHWYNNGIISINAFECPEGFVPGRLGEFHAWNKGKVSNTPRDPKTGRFIKKGR